jgi:hypothetical protein
MDDNIQKVRETTVESGDITDKTTEVSSLRNITRHRINIFERVVWFVASLIEVLLGTRFVLALLGANATNTFANFIYTTSHVFVSPFFNLFSYNGYINGISRFEGYTVVAMIVYILIATGIAQLITITRK